MTGHIAAAIVSGVFALAAVVVAGFGARVRRGLDDCLRERRQLKQVLQLTVSALVGLLPVAERDRLLIAVASALDEVEEAA